jgi:hypothetical protein
MPQGGNILPMVKGLAQAKEVELFQGGFDVNLRTTGGSRNRRLTG